MIVKFLGLADLIAGIWIMLLHLGLEVQALIGSVLAVYLIGKGVAFFGDFASYLDIAIGIWLLCLVLGASSNLSILACFYLLQKAYFSLI